MRKKFCPKCGREIEKIYNNLCKDCFLSKISLIEEIPDKIVIGRCKNCDRIYVGEKNFDSVKDAVDSVLSKIKQKEIKNIDYRIEDNKIYVAITLEVERLIKKEEKTINLFVKPITCRQCSMKFVGYFRSIIQVRAPEKLLKSIQEEIEKQIISFKPNKLAFISKIEQVKNGFDVYIGSKQVASQIAKNLKKKFKTNIKISKKLSGVMRGKTVSRDTILVSIGE